MKMIFYAAALLAALEMPQLANASLSISSSVTGSPLAGMTYDNFDSSLNTGALSVVLTPDAAAVTGSVANLYAAPYVNAGQDLSVFGNVAGAADATQYLTTGSTGSYAGASIAFNFSSPEDYFGLLWGSVDSYNTLTFYNGLAVVGTVTGPDVLNPANGYQGSGGSAYVNILSSSPFTSVVATSSQYAFELDDVAFGVVPEPSTIVAGALLVLPFGASTLRIMRKKITG